MNEFMDFCSQGLTDAGEIFGMTEVLIDGKPFEGIIDQFAASKEIEIGGFVIECEGLCMIPLLALTPKFAAPLEETLDKKLLTIGGRTFRISKPVRDEITLTLPLVNRNQA